MPAPTIRESTVECPCCAETLYTTIRYADGVVGSRGTDPKPDVDDEGLHTVCPHCRKRIALTALPRRPGDPLQYVLSTTQPCTPPK